MISVKDLTFNYGKKEIFSHYNLNVPDGEVCLITGVNGVGKTTLLRLMAGVLRPKSGEVKFDIEPEEDPRQKIGFISDHLSLYESLSIERAIEFHKSIYKISNFNETLIQHIKVDKKQKIKELSAGQRAIFHLSLILSTDPKIILIDEIIHSLDAYLRKVFVNQLLNVMSERRPTVVLVNLNFHDIEHLVDRVILLKDGKSLVDESIDSLKSKVKKIISKEIPEDFNVLYQIDYQDHSEYFIYPYKEEFKLRMDGELEDLNLTEIIGAFIGGEYAQKGNN